MGMVVVGLRTAGVDIGMVEDGRVGVSNGLDRSGEGCRSTSGEFLASGATVEECVEVDDGMVITGGIHMSTEVDMHGGSSLCKSWYGKICLMKDTCLDTMIF